MPDTTDSTTSAAAIPAANAGTSSVPPLRPYDDLSPEEQRQVDADMAEENRASGEMSRAEIDAERYQDATDPIFQRDFEERQEAALRDTSLTGGPLVTPLNEAARLERDRALSGASPDPATPTQEEELSRKTVALSLTEDQARLLLVAEYPNNVPAVYRGMFEITNLDNRVNIMNENVALDYEEDRNLFYAEMERDEKPAFLEKLDNVLEQNYRLTHPKATPTPGIDKSKDKSKEIEPEIGA